MFPSNFQGIDEESLEQGLWTSFDFITLNLSESIYHKIQYRQQQAQDTSGTRPNKDNPNVSSQMIDPPTKLENSIF